MAMKHPMDSYALQALVRLAEELDTSVDELMLHAPESWHLASDVASTLQVIDEPECRRLLSSAEVARVAYCTPAGPAILPVTYAFTAGRLVFRTSPSSPLAAVVGEPVAVEVDQVDTVRRSGWSVVVTGVAHAAIGPMVDRTGSPTVEPWPSGRRDLYVVIEPLRITGRRILVRTVVGGAHRSQAEELLR
jgi:hypothetical protein